MNILCKLPAGASWSFPASSRMRALVGGSFITIVAATMAATSPSIAFTGPEADSSVVSLTAPALVPTGCATCKWSRDNIRSLLAEIDASTNEGLDPLDYDGAELRKLADQHDASEALDQAAESAALTLAQHYLSGRISDRASQSWFIARTDENHAALVANLHAALAGNRLQPWLRSLLPTDPRYAALRGAFAALPADALDDRAQVRDNLERWRWLPRQLGANHVFVNVPSYTLQLVEHGVAVSSYDVVVGGPATPTPQIAAAAQTVVVNPSWNVPPSIVRSSRMKAGKPGFVTTVGSGGSLSFSQPPGPRNALGRIKIDMPNPHSIYLHNTQAKSLFQRSSRAFSHGCIRVKEVEKLAAELVARDSGDPRRVTAALTSYRTTPLRLHTARPVYLVYFTMEVGSDGRLVRHDDPYGRDARITRTLAGLTHRAAGGPQLAFTGQPNPTRVKRA